MARKKKKINYDTYTHFRIGDKGKEIFKTLKKKTGLSYSELIRRVFIYFDKNYITLLRILEETKNDK